MAKRKSEDHADVLLVTATMIETQAVLDVFGVPKPPPAVCKNRRTYFDLGTVNGARVMLTQSEMGASGLGAALQTVEKGITSLKPDAVILVGIAFGMNEAKQGIGDVLVAQQLRPYDLQRVGTNKRGTMKIILRDDKPHSSSWLLNLLKSSGGSWQGSKLWFGPILTGAKLVDNIDFRNQLNILEPEAIGGEMEGGGLYAACHENKVDWIVVKAICDFADGQKGKDEEKRQAQAAKNAAAFVHYTLQYVEVDEWNKGHGQIQPNADNSPDNSIHDVTVERDTSGEIAEEAAFGNRLSHSVPLDGFRVVTWNIGGGKFLELNEVERTKFHTALNSALRDLVHNHKPHVVLLQEVVQYEGSYISGKNPASVTTGQKPVIENVVSEIPGYYYDVSIAIDTNNQSHPLKWQKYRENGGWPTKSYLAQGYGILWHETLKHAPIWEFLPSTGSPIEKEIVRLETGLFTGSRDTEPRLAVVVHFVLDRDKKPLDVFVVNLHLTTLKGEREGSPERDMAASAIRQQQLNIVTNGIVSRYNEWVKHEDPNRQPAIWVFGGDFNSMPSSFEITGVGQRNFIDLNPDKGGGTKGRQVPIVEATITLDYLLAGPAYHALDPYLLAPDPKKNPQPLDIYRVSDHFPVRADVPVR